jgi:hypothetical protein
MPTFNLLGLEIYIPDLDEIIKAVTEPLQSAITAVQTGVVNTLSPLFDAVTSTLSSAVSGVVTQISNLFSDSLKWLTDTLASAWDVLKGLGAQISTAVGDLWTSIEDSLSSLQTVITDALTAAQNTLSGALTTAQDALNGAITGAQTALSGALDTAGSTISGALETAQGVLMDAFDGMGNAISGTIGGILSGFGSIDIGAVMSSHTGGAAQMASAIISLGLFHSPITPDEAFQWATPFIIQVTSAATSLHIANIAAEAASLGQIDVTLSEVWEYPETKAAMSAAGELSAMPIKEGMFPAFKRYILKNYVPFVPNLSSLMDVYAKEGYLADHWVEIPDGLINDFAENGYSLEWAQKIWGAHWKHPDLSQLIEMLHRTMGTSPQIGITQTIIEDMLKIEAYAPKWRNPLALINWRTWPLRDIRTGWETGDLSDPDLVNRIVDAGYSPEDAPLIADNQKLMVLRSEIDALGVQTTDDYVAGWITEDQLRADLEATPYRAEVIELRIAKAKMQRARALKTDLKAALGDRYLKGDLTDAEFTQELSRLGVTQEWISSEVTRIQAKKLKKVKEETTVTTKALTESQYSRALRVGLIPEATYRNLLAGLKISQDDINLLVELNTPEKPAPAEIPTLTLGELKAAFRAQVLSEDELRAELGARKYSDENISTIIETEKTKIKVPTTEQ